MTAPRGFKIDLSRPFIDVLVRPWFSSSLSKTLHHKPWRHKVKKSTKTIGFYSVPGLAAIETFASIHIQIFIWCVLVFAWKMMKNEVQEGLKSYENRSWVQNRFQRRKKIVKGAPRSLQDGSMAPQDEPRTRPRRLQDASKTASNRFLSEVASYIAFWTSKSTLKWSPKALQDASRTHLWEGQLRQANGKKKNSETDRKTVRQANNQQTNTRTNRPTDLQKEIER